MTVSAETRWRRVEERIDNRPSGLNPRNDIELRARVDLWYETIEEEARKARSCWMRCKDGKPFAFHFGTKHWREETRARDGAMLDKRRY
jgi:hypothetical protein